MPALSDICGTCNKTYSKHFVNDCDDPPTNRKWTDKLQVQTAPIVRDLRTHWTSDDGLWAVVRGGDLWQDFQSAQRPAMPIAGLNENAVLSYGYFTVKEAANHQISTWVRRIPTGIVSVGSGTCGWWPLSCQRSIGCFYKIRRDELPWERDAIATDRAVTRPIKKVIPEFPRVCNLCGAPAYLGLNEVVHDPKAVKAIGCRGMVIDG